MGFGTVGKGIRALLALAAVVVVATVATAELKIRSEVNDKIRSALAAHYRGMKVSIDDDDKGPLHQMCLVLAIKDPITGASTRRFAMVNGDLDGGVWVFGREYSTMADCRKDYLVGG